MNKPVSQSEFDKKLKTGRLAITLVGMSNVGKSYWASRLAKEKDFRYINCDDLIEDQLNKTLKKHGHKKGLAGVANWLGQPYEADFKAKQKAFVQIEVSVMLKVIEYLKAKHTHSIVIDTAGSVIHTNSNICKQLKTLTTVVYLKATSDMRDKMFELYIKEPKPVVWGNTFNMKADEDPVEALARTYPHLLAFRSKLYADMADVTIHRSVSLALTDSDHFLNHVKSKLPVTANSALTV